MHNLRFTSTTTPVVPGWHRQLKVQSTPQAYESARLKFLSQSWERLNQKLSIPASVSQKTFQDLITAYQADSPQVRLPRVYHSLDHLVDCLTLLQAYQQDTANPPLTDPILLETALWFHDAVDERNYPTGVDDSAQAARNFLNQSSDPQNRAPRNLDTLARLILQTRYGSPPPGPMTLDEQVMTDIDLSILGQQEAVYDDYALAIRQEYAFVDDPAYRLGRAGVLQGILKRKPLYQTSWGQRLFESQAQANLQRELASLSPP